MPGLALSVVIGAHNAAHVIDECLSALEAQDGRSDAEIILADCSTDGTAEIVRTRFPSVQVTWSQEGRGTGIAALTILDRASAR